MSPAVADLPAPLGLRTTDYQRQLNSWSYALESRGEHGDLDFEFTLRPYLGRHSLVAPFLLFQPADGIRLTAGSQRLLSFDPFLEDIPVDALRLDAVRGSWRLSTSAGASSDAELQPGVEWPHYRFGAVAIEWEPSESARARLAVSGWDSPSPAIPTRTLLAADLHGLSSRFGYLDVRLGQDLRHLDPSSRAIDVQAGFRLPRISLTAKQTLQGRSYGPPVTTLNRSETNHWKVIGSFLLTSALRAQSTYEKYQETFQGSFGLGRNVQSHGVVWSGARTRLMARWRRTQSDDVSAAAALEQYEMEASWRTQGGLDISPVLNFVPATGERSSFWVGEVGVSLGGTRRHRGNVRISGTWERNAWQEKRFRLGYNYSPLGSSRFSLEYSARFDRDRSLLQTLTTDLQWQFLPWWRIDGAASGSRGTGFATNTRVSLGTTVSVNRHTEASFQYLYDPLSPDYLPKEIAIAGPHLFSAALRQSWGGPREMRLERSLRPRLLVEAIQRVPGAGVTPFPGAPIVINRTVRLATDRRGRLYIDDLLPGPTEIRLDTTRLPSNYELNGSAARRIVLGTRKEYRLTYEVWAWSSVYVVVWNDVDGTHRLPVGYIPFPAIPIQLDDREAVPTDLDGVTEFRRLRSGSYRLRVPADALPPATVPTTETTFEFELSPGEERVIEIGLRAMGRIRGRVLRVGSDGQSREPGPAGLGILLRGKIVERTDAHGRFDLEVPAGRLPVTVQTVLGSDRYEILGDSLQSVDVAPADTADVEFVISQLGSITVTVQIDNVGVGGVPVELAGGPFLYTDERGRVLFESVSAGVHTVKVDPDYLPPDYTVVGPNSRLVELRPGQDAEISFSLKRR